MTDGRRDDLAVELTFAAFFVGALVRGNATYWLGRGLRHGAARTRLASRLDAPGLLRAQRLVARFGAPAVSLSFLTVGVQSAVNAAAGALRMPMRRYLPAVVIGALLWATLYTTIGLSVWQAWVGGALRRLWPGVVAVAVIGAVTWLARRRRRPSGAPPTCGTGEAGHAPDGLTGDRPNRDGTVGG